MAKKIKFNLNIDNKQIRDLDGLKENFNLSDLFELYKNKTLHRWLECRDYKDYLQKINEIATYDEREIAKKLIDIFDGDFENYEAEEILSDLFYAIRQKDYLSQININGANLKNIIENYHKRYNEIKKEIFENKENIGVLRTLSNEIYADFEYLFFIDKKQFFNEFISDAQFMILALLLNKNLRDEILNESDFVSSLMSLTNSIKVNKKKIIVQLAKNEITNDNMNFIKYFSGKTEGYWKDLELKEKEFMVLYIGNGSYVRSAGKLGEELTSSDVNGKFPILNGIDYKSNNDTHILLYIEV